MNTKKTLFVLLLLLGYSFLGISQNVDNEMQNLLKKKRVYNQSIKIEVGYRIQLYNGMGESKARSVLGAFSELYPETTTHLIYEQPEWKVQTATFKTELEAYKVWLKIRENFSGTFIFEVK